MITPQTLLVIHSFVFPVLGSGSVLLIERYVHARREYRRAFTRSVSLGISAKKHPDKEVLLALFIASEAELQYACGLKGKDFEEAKKEVDRQIEIEMDPDAWNYMV